MAVPSTLGMLGWAYQSTVLSNIKPKTSFLKALMFGGREENLPTETVEVGYKEGHTEMAPFVEVNAEATSVKGNSIRLGNVSAPNIRIKRPMDAYNAFVRRLPGTGMFITSGDVVQAARQAAIADDLQTLSDMIERREEWMVAQMLNGRTAGYIQLSYSVSEQANFTISVPRSTSMVGTVSTSWATGDIASDIHNVKLAMSRYQQLAPTVCVLGSNASLLFRTNATVRATLDTKNVSAGALDLQGQFDTSGAIYLGRYAGIEFWEYGAQFTADTTGTATDYIGADNAVFLHVAPTNEAKFYYGAIPDHDAFDEGMFVGKRFGKSWKEKDPSAFIQLEHTRPLPVIRRPGSIFNLDVTP